MTTRAIRRTLGLGLLGLSDAMHASALVLVPLWLAHRYAPHAGYGSGLAVGPAVVMFAVALCQPVGRAVLRLAGLGLALTLCALAWPLPDWAWFAALCAGSILGAVARQLTRVRTGRLSGPMIGVSIIGLVVAHATLGLDEAGRTSVRLTLTLLIFVAPLWMLWRLGRVALAGATSPVLDEVSEWWERRARARLAARGLVPLDPLVAPVLYRRVEKNPDGEWEWEIRDGQRVLSKGHATRRSKAERAASRACFAKTFAAPYAPRPGALYVLAPVSGNPYTVRVTEVFNETRAGGRGE